MPSFTVKLKWGKELYEGVDLNTDEEPMVFKAQVFALTGVQPHRQKVMVKGATLKDDSWDPIKPKVKNGATLLLMGSKEEDIKSAAAPAQKTQFIEDMDESQINSALKMPAGLTNLGNTCYMNATIQCLKSVPEFKDALLKFEGDFAGAESAAASSDSPFSQALTVALRDLYKTMDRGSTVPPIILLQVLHSAFPRFAERGEQGGYQQQDANECWEAMLNTVKQKLMVKPEDASIARSVIDDYFGLEFDTETKCVESEDEPVSKSKERFLQYNCYIDKEVKYLASGLKNRLQESLTKKSATLDRDAEYVKTLRVSRLPGYLTVQMVRFQFKQKDAINAKILKDVKFPMMLDTFELCTEQLQQKLVPMRNKFKAHEDYIVEQASKDKHKGGREAAIKKSREEAEDKEMEPYFFSDDSGSNNSGYYELQAILTHKGRSSNSGHYVAWVKHKGDTWIECNDDEVSPVHVEDVMKLSGGGDWHCAYLLIYGPRKLPKDFSSVVAAAAATEEKARTETEKSSSTEEKMETS